MADHTEGILLNDLSYSLKISSEAFNHRVENEGGQSAVYRMARANIEVLYKLRGYVKKSMQNH